MVEPGGVRPADRRRSCCSALFAAVRVARARPDAAAGAVSPAELLGREHRDVRDVCGPVDPVLLPRPVPAADRRLHAAAERPGDAAGDGDHVRAVAPLRRARRSLRAAPVHGRRAAGRRRAGCCCSSAIGAEGRLRLRSAARAARVRARAVDDGGAADRGGARRARRRAGGHRLGRQQRDRARGGAARHGGASARSSRRRSARRSTAAWRARRSGPRRVRPWRRPSGCRSGARTCTGCRRRRRRALASAAEQASLHSFHLGMAIAAALVAVGRRGGRGRDSQPAASEVRAADCAGGQLVGASSELGQPAASAGAARRLSRRARARRRASRR